MRVHLFRLISLGASTGVATAFAIWLLSIAGGGATVSAPGLLLAGALIGAVHAGFVVPGRYRIPDHAMGGSVVALAAWIALPMNIYPALIGQGPMWSAGEVAGELFPALVAFLLIGLTTGAVYGAIHGGFAERLGLVEPDVEPPAIRTRIVVLGGGYAGVAAAQRLERELGNDPEVGIWLVNATNYMLHTPMLSEVSSSSVSPNHIVPPLRSFFARVQVVESEVEGIDLDARVVHFASDSGRDLPFDHLVIALGSVTRFANEAVRTHALKFKSLGDALAVRDRVIEMFERADRESDPDVRRRRLTFVVAGGGFAGVELVGALNDFARGIRPYYPNVEPREIRLLLVHSGDRILPELSESLAAYAMEKLGQRGVEFELGRHVTDARSHAVTIGDREIAADTLVWTAGNRPHPILGTFGLPLTDRGQLEADPELTVPGASCIWAGGDCARVPDLENGGFVPPTAQHAVRQGKLLGRNVAAAVRGEPPEAFRYDARGSLAVLGHQLAVAEVFGRRFSGLAAWLMWRAVYLWKLPTFEKRVRVGIDWALDIFFPPDIVRATSDAGEEDPT